MPSLPRALIVNAVLVVAAIVLAALVWWPRASVEPAASATAAIGPVAPGKLTRLAVRRGSDRVTLSRIDGRWRLTSPVHAPADSAHIQALLALDQATPVRRIAGNIPPAVSGLGRQAIVVRYNDTPPIRIGSPGPQPASYYVATRHGHFLVTIPHFDVLHWRWTDWLDRALVPPGKTLSRLVLPHFVISRDKAGDWQAAPAGARSGAAAAATAAAWANVEALAIVPADSSQASLGRITLDFTDGSKRVLQVVEDKPNLVLRDPALGVAYQLAGNRIAPLLDLRHPGL